MINESISTYKLNIYVYIYIFLHKYLRGGCILGQSRTRVCCQVRQVMINKIVAVLVLTVAVGKNVGGCD